MYILGLNSDLSCGGFYREGIHDSIPSLNITVSNELRSELLLIGNFRIKAKTALEDRVYNLEDLPLFSPVKIPQEIPEPTKADIIEEQNANLIKESLEKDIKIKDLNMSLAQTTLNLINKDIEVKDLNTNLANTTLNLVSKDIEVKDIQKDIASLILKTLGGN